MSRNKVSAWALDPVMVEGEAYAPGDGIPGFDARENAALLHRRVVTLDAEEAALVRQNHADFLAGQEEAARSAAAEAYAAECDRLRPMVAELVADALAAHGLLKQEPGK